MMVFAINIAARCTGFQQSRSPWTGFLLNCRRSSRDGGRFSLSPRMSLRESDNLLPQERPGSGYSKLIRSGTIWNGDYAKSG